MPGRGTRARAIRIPDDLWDAAKEIAHRRGETLAEVVRQALRDYVDRHRDEA